MGVKSSGANGIRPVAMLTVPLAVNTPSTWGSPARPCMYCMPAAPAPPCRVITFTRCPSKCGGAASAKARERRSEGPPGVAQETISMGRLGKAASSARGEHAAGTQQDERSGEEAGEPGRGPELAATRRGCGLRLE